MKYRFVLLLLVFISLAAPAQELIKLTDLQNIINDAGPVKVINFWATWCAPCVKELPYFEKLNQENKNVKVVLVSMDYDLDPNPAKVKRFVERKKLLSSVVILAEENPNAWIEKIDKNWTGALPSTLIVNPGNGKRKLVQHELKEGELENLIEAVK